MKPKILVAREVFPEVLERLRQYFEVDDNQADAVLGVEGLKARLADKAGALTAATDPVTAEVIAAAPQLKAICNFAVGYNNIDLAACSRARGSWRPTRPAYSTTPRLTSPGRC
jgi:gluconate 2-dehydrogenase